MNSTISFSEWMLQQKHIKSTATKYLKALENAGEWLSIELPMPIMQCHNLDDFYKIKSSILSAPNFKAINKAHGSGDISASLSAYEKYLKYIRGSSDTFSPRWFAEQAVLMDLESLREEDKQLRSSFVENFGIDALSKLNGTELLTRLFYSDDDNKNNMCYMLEFHPRIRELYGSIAGGSAFKYGLFYHSKKQCWMTGSPHNPIQLTEDQAIKTAESIRDELIEGAEILDSHTFVAEDTDYEYLFDEIKHISLIDKVWALKYYQMLFPEILPVFYSQEYLSDVLKLIGKSPCGCKFINMGMISTFIKKCGISAVEFSQIYHNVVLSQVEHDDDSEEDALSDEGHIRYWMYTPGEKSLMWDDFYTNGIMAIGWSEIGDLSSYSTKEEMKAEMQRAYGGDSSFRNAAHATWQFANEIQIGDIVFVKRGRDQIIGRGIVRSNYYYDTEKDEYPNCREMEWTHKGVWDHPEGMAALKTLTEITPYTDYIQKLSDIFLDEEIEDNEDTAVEYPIYGKQDFLRDVFMSEDDYEKLVQLLKKKKNVILQGAPGVGKTFAAKRLAYSLIGAKAQNQVMMIQFHQSYSYEDFIMGFRPSQSGFELKKGPFYNFCKTAEIDSENDYFFIIDEINRGNLSKIFGEMFMLIESDKRGVPLQLLYSDEKFSIPKNVYIIGMMNTADRSLAMLDFALRRRFAFYEMHPGFKTKGFMDYQASLNSVSFDNLILCIEKLNKAICEDDSLGEGFCIGHSYFCNLNEGQIGNTDLSSIIEFEIIPLLKEYWFDEIQVVEEWSGKLRSVLK